jgi:hypothetical protein
MHIQVKHTFRPLILDEGFSAELSGFRVAVLHKAIIKQLKRGKLRLNTGRRYSAE